MENRINEKKEIIKQENTIEESSKLSPVEEYNYMNKKHIKIIILFILLILVEIGGSIYSISETHTYDLNYRVIREIENNIRGKNYLPTGIYTGETDFGYFIGNGTFHYKTGSFYEGQWNNNNMQGFGVLGIPNEGTYEGMFSHSKKNGNGTFEWEDGSIYIGEWKNDQMNGKGTYKSFDKVKYIGTFENNLFKSGKCSFSNLTGTYNAIYKEFAIDNIIINFTDGASYDGGSDGSYLQGKGTMKFKNGDKYIGRFNKSTRNGRGTYFWSNGDVYNGVWMNDAMEGFGKYTYANGSIAKGNFVENKFTDGKYMVNTQEGKYTFKIKNSKPVRIKIILKNGITYSGGMKNGKLTGNAKITYNNGDKYKGHVKNGHKNGYGTYTWSKGAYYEGNWLGDKMNGEGTYFYDESEDGYKLTGTFEKGFPEGECQYYTNSYESYTTNWKSGKCVKIYE